MTTIGAVYGDPTPLEASNEPSTFQLWRVRMLARDLWEDISLGPPRRAGRGRRGNVKGNSNTCKTDTKPELIQMRDLHNGNELCLISPSGLGKEIGYES